MSNGNETINLLNTRRSIRKFQNKEVSHDIIEQILKSGQRAPTACGMEPYSFILISDTEKRDKIKNATVSHKATRRYMDESTVWIMICVDFARQIELNEFLGKKPELGEMSKFLLGVIDASLAAENMVIAAEAFGLGSCFVGSIWIKPLEVSEILELPKFVYPLMLLCIGYPDEKPQIRNRWPLEAILHKNSYSKVSNQILSDFIKKRSGWTIGSPYIMDYETSKKIKEDLKKIGFVL